MRVLLTGGFGYLGGRLAQHLAASGHDVVLGSRNKYEAPRWLLGATTIAMDWQSPERLAESCQGIDCIVHLAGMNAADCARDPVAALAFNGLATARLVEAAAHGVQRLVYLSTAHVYAAPLIGEFDEITLPRNLHPYATSHRAGEDVVLAAQAAGQIEGVVIRLSNAFGAPAGTAGDCWTLLVNDLSRQAARSGQMVLKSGGSQQRDFIALTDFCRVAAALMTLPPEMLGLGLFNVGSGRSWTVREMAERVAARFTALTGRPCPIVRPPDSDINCPADLHYRIENLVAAGIQAPTLSGIDAEIDDLLRYCLAEAN